MATSLIVTESAGTASGAVTLLECIADTATSSTTTTVTTASATTTETSTTASAATSSTLVTESAGTASGAVTLLECITCASSSTTTTTISVSTATTETSTTASSAATTTTLHTGFLGILALLATDRLVVEALLLVKLLLTTGEDKSITTVLAFKVFVSEAVSFLNILLLLFFRSSLGFLLCGLDWRSLLLLGRTTTCLNKDKILGK